MEERFRKEIKDGSGVNMDHVVIMKKSWHLLEKIISGEKICESRWYKFRRDPWDRVKVGDILWFKNSGESVTLKAVAKKVVQFSNLDQKKVRKIIKKHGRDICLQQKFDEPLDEYFLSKNYCILVYLEKVKEIKPFDIDKTGFGISSAWLCVDDIKKIKKD